VTTPFLRNVKLLEVQKGYYYVFLHRRNEVGEQEIMHIGMITTSNKNQEAVYDCRRQIISGHEVSYNSQSESYEDKPASDLPLRVTLGVVHYVDL